MPNPAEISALRAKLLRAQEHLHNTSLALCNQPRERDVTRYIIAKREVLHIIALMYPSGRTSHASDLRARKLREKNRAL